MRKIFLLMLLMFGCYGAFASDFEVDGVYYDICGSNQVKVVQPDEGKAYSGDVVIPETVEHTEFWYGEAETTQYTVVEVDAQAFESSSNLGSLTINANLEELEIRNAEIQQLKFSHCLRVTLYDCKLHALEVSDATDVLSLNGVSLLSSLVVPGTVGSCSLQNCRDLQNLTLQESSSALDLKIDEETPILDMTINRETTLRNVIPQSVVSLFLGDKITFLAYSGLSSLKKIVGNGITVINSLSGTTSLESMSFPKLREICSEAFNGSGIKEINLPNTLESIGDFAFANCTNLASITINSNVVLGSGVFYKCSSLAEFSLPNELDSLGHDMFNGCKALKEISLPHALTKIPERAFFDCASLEKVYINANIVSIEKEAFAGCVKLQSIDFPASLKRIEKGAFDDCEGLTELFLPKSLEYVGPAAFIEVKLDKLHYAGNLEDWMKVKIDIEATGTFYPNTTNPISNAKEFYLSTGLLTDLVIPVGVETVTPWSFTGYLGLKSVTLPKWVKKVGEGAFFACLLDKVVIQSEELEVGKAGFYVSDWYQEEGISNVVVSKNLKKFTGPFPKANTIDYDGTLDDWLSIKLGLSNEMFAYGGKGMLRINGTPVDEVTLPYGTWAVSNYQFAGMSLSTVYIPTSVRRIGKYAFSNCSALQKVLRPANSARTYARTSFAASDESITVGDYAFWFDKKLTQIDIVEVVDSVGEKAFDGTVWLEAQPAEGMQIIGKSVYAYKGEAPATLIIPDGIVNICREAFNGQKNIMSAELPSTLKYISPYAFSECENLTSINLPNSLLSIAEGAFRSCGKLTGVELPNALEYIGDAAFYNTDLRQLRIPKSVKAVDGYYAFYGAPIKSLVIEDGDDELKFKGNGLTRVETAYIGRPGFFEESNYDYLTKVILGKNVTEIPMRFCSYLEEFTVLSKTPPAAPREEYFEHRTYTDCKLIVPQGSLDAYKAAPIWKDFYNIVEADLTSVNAIHNDSPKPCRYYDMSGKRLNGEQKGLMIKKSADGVVRKYVKK